MVEGGMDSFPGRGHPGRSGSLVHFPIVRVDFFGQAILQNRSLAVGKYIDIDLGK